MSDDGYTLSEMLAALVMVALAVSGVGAATRTIGFSQAQLKSRHEAQSDWALFQRVASASLSVSGPFGGPAAGTEPFVGDQHVLTFACGTQNCSWTMERDRTGASVRLADAHGAHTFALHGSRAPEFRYITDSGQTRPSWPTQDGTARLAAVAVFDADRPKSVFKIGIEQSALCVFEAQGCKADSGGLVDE